MEEKALQDYYEDAAAVCYGCGRLNEQGLQIKSYWEGDEAVCRYKPRPYHMAIAGYVYGGLLASLVDCHSTGTAAAAAYRAAGRPMGTEPRLRYVTASLHVDYLRPTPIDAEMEIRAHPTAIGDNTITVESTVYADGVATARGQAVLARMPDHWLRKDRGLEGDNESSPPQSSMSNS